MRVLVCGGRKYDDWDTLNKELTQSLVDGMTAIIHGGATGADTLAGQFAVASHIPEIVFPARWKDHGYAAGPIRNQQMLEDGKPGLVIAFPGGRGTADMIKRARNAGIPVREIK